MGSVGEIKAPNIQTEDAQKTVTQQADQHSGNQHADGRKKKNRPALRLKFLKIHVERTGKQQETEHDLQQQLIKCNLLYKLELQPHEAVINDAGNHQADRKYNGHDHQPNGQGQFQETGVDVSE